MRKIILPFALLGLVSLPMVACDVEAEGDTVTGDDTDTTVNPEVPVETKYYSVIVDDSAIFPTHRSDGGNPCATSSSNAHGADIDAVGLFDGSDLVGYVDAVDYMEASGCTGADAPAYTEANEAKGAPDGKLTEGFVSLGGGYLAVEFDARAQVINGYDIVVYEVGTKCGSNTACGGVDEGYEVFVAKSNDCVNTANYPYASCADKLSDDAKGEATIPVAGL